MDYGRPVRKSPSLYGRKSTPTPKFFGTAEAYFVCYIGPNFQIFLIYAFIGCPKSVDHTIYQAVGMAEVSKEAKLHRKFEYSKVASSNTSCLEQHAGFFRLLMKGIFDPYVCTVTF